MPQPTTEELSTPTPESSCGPVPPAGSSSPSQSVSLLHAVVPPIASSVVAMFTAWKAAEWLPTCLSMVRLPSGGVSHDYLAWAPLLLDLLALVAIGAPVSFKSILDVAHAFWPGRPARGDRYGE